MWHCRIPKFKARARDKSDVGHETILRRHELGLPIWAAIALDLYVTEHDLSDLDVRNERVGGRTVEPVLEQNDLGIPTRGDRGGRAGCTRVCLNNAAYQEPGAVV